MRMRRWCLVLGLGLSVSSCASAPPVKASPPTSAAPRCAAPCPAASSFEVASSPLTALATWHPTPAASSSPALKARAFDHWQLDDAGFMQELWPALSASLDYLRGQVPAQRPKLRRTFDTLLAIIEPAGVVEGRLSAPTLELTFVTGEDQGRAWEGVLCRVFAVMDSGALPGVSFLLKRRVGEGAQPSQVLLWGSSGYEEGAPFSARIAREVAVSKPMASKPVAKLILSEGHHVELVEGYEDRSAAGVLVLELLTRVLWLKVSQQAYLEPKLKRVQAARPALAAYPQGAGLTVQERELEEIFDDTVFIPLEELEGMLPGLKRSGE